MKTDLTTLYSELDLKPDCSLAEFQLACRRRIRKLHPVRLGTAASPESAAELREVIELYGMATRFHRRHGRLPGAPPKPSPAPSPSPMPPVNSETQPLGRVSHMLDEQNGDPKAYMGLVIVFLFLLFVGAVLVSVGWLR